MRFPRALTPLLAASCLGLGPLCAGTDVGVPLPAGTWGGENAGAVVNETEIHLHIGCTEGNAPRPVVASDGRFEVTGQHNVDAYPVNLGIYHPARFYGTWRGGVLRVSVELTDIRLTLGPAELTHGGEPQTGMCPICTRVPR